MHATPVTDDDWAIALKAQEDRAMMREKAAIARRDMIWRGVGGITATAVVVAGVLGIGWFVHDSVEGTREGDIRIEEERTDQIGFCVALEVPLERQYCLMSVNNDPKGDG